MRILRIAVGFLVVVVIGLAWFEISMQPTGTERAQLLAMFLVVALAAGVAALVLPGLASRSSSVRRTITLLSITAVVIVAGGVALVASQMFLSSHDLSLVFVVLGFGVLSGLAFGVAVARPWTDDLERMAHAADRVAAGDFDARTGVERRDEVGQLAASIDTMAQRLAAAEEVRRRDEASRRHFLAAIGHDLRTPLAALQASIEALRDGVAPDPDRYLKSMEHDVAALSSLVDDLFLLAKIESGSLEIQPSLVDIAEVADEAIEVLRPVAARRAVTLRLEAEDHTVVSGGPEALSRVMRNLLDNAIRYAPDNTEVLVSVSNGNDALVTVVDQGPGFDADFVARAFASFQRSDPARARDTGGAGLGLAIAHGFISAMGGKIWAEPGPGGVVSFRLPVQ